MPASDEPIPIPVTGHADRVLERAFASLADVNPSLALALRNAVCAYVDEAKARGDPPEGVIVAIKHIAERAGISGARSMRISGMAFSVQEALLQDAVTWCIARYYEEDEREYAYSRSSNRVANARRTDTPQEHVRVLVTRC